MIILPFYTGLLNKSPIRVLLFKRNVPVEGVCFVNMTSRPSTYWFNISSLLRDGRL